MLRPGRPGIHPGKRVFLRKRRTRWRMIGAHGGGWNRSGSMAKGTGEEKKSPLIFLFREKAGRRKEILNSSGKSWAWDSPILQEKKL
jgi:hypothetical protein